MRVESRTRDALLVRSGVAGARALTVIFVAVGCGMLFGPLVGGGWVEPVLVLFGTVFTAAGLSLIYFIRPVSVGIDRRARELRIVTHKLGGDALEVIPLDTVDGAEVERSVGSKGSETFRVAIVLKDGRRHPLTSYYSGGRQDKALVAAAIDSFLHDRPMHVAASTSDTSMAAVLIAPVCLLMMAVGAWHAWAEHDRLTRYQPVPVTIESATVRRHSSSDGADTYSPAIAYSYEVNGTRFRSDRVLPVNESRSGRWAHDIVAGYRAGAQHTGWYDPQRPSEAYLLRRRSVVPWLAIVLPLGVLAATGAGALRSGSSRIAITS